MPATATARRLPASGLLLLSLILAACGAGSASPSGAPPSVVPNPPATAIDTDTLLGGDSLDGQPVRVAGFFLAVGDTALLCSVVLESYPPQCGGGTVRITGEVPADVLDALDSTTDPALVQANWGQVEVTGTFRSNGVGGTPTIQLASIRVVPPAR